MARRSKPAGVAKPNNALTVEQTPDETGAQALARKLLEPHLRHALSASAFAGKVLGSEIEGPGIMDCVDHMQTATCRAEAAKAQANSRATLEALARLHLPREQTVRHVHVNEGGQAVIAEQVHNHPGALENGKSVKQSHATGPAGASASLPSPDAGGNRVPIPSGEREAAMQDARRHESGGI